MDKPKTLACRLVRKEDLQSTVTYQHPESLRLAWAKQDPVSKGNGDIADRYTDCVPGASEKVASLEMSLICT